MKTLVKDTYNPFGLAEAVAAQWIKDGKAAPADFVNGSGLLLTWDRAWFLQSVAAGGLIATLSDPFFGSRFGSAPTTYATFGAVPAQLALAGNAIVAGAGAIVAGTPYTIGVEAISGNGARRVGDTLTLTALAPLAISAASFAGGTPPGTPIANITGLGIGEIVIGKTSTSGAVQLSADGLGLLAGSTVTPAYAGGLPYSTGAITITTSFGRMLTFAMTIT